MTEREVAYTRRDVLLYALGVGADELPFTYELDPAFAALPTYPFALSFKGNAVDVVPFDLVDRLTALLPSLQPFDVTQLVQGELSLELARPLPVEGRFRLTSRVLEVTDKGSGLLVVTEDVLTDDAGVAVARIVGGAFVRGKGSGRPRPPAARQRDDGDLHRPPDAVASYAVPAQLAMLYRLSGESNPLHADPAVAAAAGLPRPNLHGQCTLAIAARHVLRHFAANDPARFKAIKGRFTAAFFPGETLVTEMWRVDSDAALGVLRIRFRARVAERDSIVVSDGVAELYSDPRRERRL